MKSIRPILACSVFLISTASESMATAAANCSVLPSDDLNGLFLAPSAPSPHPASVNLITVRNCDNHPISEANVTVTLLAANTICGSTSLSGMTNAQGEVTLTLGGGGCTSNSPLSGVVKANGITIRAYENVKSPDFDGAKGDLQVNIADLVTFSHEFLSGTGGGECHDYDNDGTTGLPELVLFGPAFTTPNTCTP